MESRLLTPDTEPNDPIERFISEASKADGRLIELPGRTSRAGDAFFYSARYGQADGKPENNNDVSWCLVTDVFAQVNGRFVPVGLRDYIIHSREARGFISHRNILPTAHEAHEIADRFWIGRSGIQVNDQKLRDYIQKDASIEKWMKLYADMNNPYIGNEVDNYRRLGIASFMNAAAMQILHTKGVEKIVFEDLTQGGEAVWRKLGKDDYNNVLFLKDAIKHENVINALKMFVYPGTYN